MKEQIKALRALADETRLRIVCLLMGKDRLCVCQIIDALKMKQSTVSKALKVLKEAGIIEDSRKAQWIYYNLNKSGKNPVFWALNSVSKEAAKSDKCISDSKNLEAWFKTNCKGAKK